MQGKKLMQNLSKIERASYKFSHYINCELILTKEETDIIKKFREGKQKSCFGNYDIYPCDDECNSQEVCRVYNLKILENKNVY